MNMRDIPFSVLYQIHLLQDEIAALEDGWTVGNYFERIELINHKKAQLAQLKRYE